LNCGEDVKSPAIQRALANLRALDKPAMVYAVSLQTMALCAAEPDKDRLIIDRNVRWLEAIQINTGSRKGSWGYSDKQGQGDNSNTQFALLGLHEAARAGVTVNDSTWRLALDYWLRQQKDDGSWGYFEDQPSTGSMTCAGIASVVIAAGKISDGSADVSGDTIRCCGATNQDDSVERGLAWLGQKFSVHTNPSGLSTRGTAVSRAWLLYYLYGVERVGRLTGRRFIGRHDWYREGAEMLVSQQDRFSGFWKGIGHAESNPLVATSLALLFLSKGRRPVVMANLMHGEGDDWNQHPAAIHALARQVETRWKRDLTWQTIDLGTATLEDLLQTPVLFISGRGPFQLSAEQKDNLREYVNQGGFIFAEACDGEGCEGQAFDKSFRAMTVELFGSELRRLPPDHAVWFAEERFDADHLPSGVWLYGVDACCRTSVVYCPKTLSCYWQLSRVGRESTYPQSVQQRIDACVSVGANVLAYATNRQLKEKLDRPRIAVRDSDADVVTRGTLHVPKLSHSGGADDAPNALANLLTVLRDHVQLPLSVSRRLLLPTDDELHDYPIVFMHGRRDFRFTPSERQAVRDFIDRGGMIFADAICASPEFTNAFRREIETIFPDQRLTQIPDTHVLLTDQFQGFDLSSVTLRDPEVRSEDEPLRAKLRRIKPLLEGVEVDGRLVVVFSPYDLSCALENHASLECKGYTKADAARIGVNVILFALQQ
jgi:hypothetical protein